jgi:spermidine synthase
MYRRFAIFCALFGLGFVSISTQIYLFRELLFVFQGNELIFGVGLANWMLLTGFGAFIGRFSGQIKNREPFFLFLMLLLAIIPILTILKLDIWRSVILPPGVMAGLKDIYYTSLLMQTPVCFLSGFLFTSFTALLPPRLEAPVGSMFRRFPIGSAYAVESLGALVAGLLVNAVLLWTVGSFEALRILAIGFLVTVVLFAFLIKSWFPRIITPLVAGGIVWMIFSFPFHEFSLSMLFEGETIVADQETPYGRVIMTSDNGQDNLYENGMLLFSSGNVISDEESVHFGMIQHPDPQRVLLISGGLSGAMDEIIKYQPEQIDYMELNPALVDLFRPAEGEITEAPPRIERYTTDARRFLTRTDALYDVVLMNVPEPSTLQLNRYFTSEFFHLVHQHLTPGGVLSLSLPTSSNYVSEEARELNSSIFQTLRTSFQHVLILPSGENFFIASDSVLSVSIPTLIAQRQIETDYVNPYYFDENLLHDRSRFMHQSIDTTASLNHDFRPVAYFYQQSYWLSHFRQNYALIGGITLLLLVLTFLAYSPVNAGLFSAGFTGASIEVILLLGFQILYGYVYQALGVLIMVFMLGLALGAGLRQYLIPNPRPRLYLFVQLLLAALCLLILVFFTLMPFMVLPDALVFTLFLILAITVAALTGIEFSFAALLSRGGLDKITASNYAVDLYGSALGALLTAIILLPLAGIYNTLLILALLNTVSGALFVYGRRRR